MMWSAKPWLALAALSLVVGIFWHLALWGIEVGLVIAFICYASDPMGPS